MSWRIILLPVLATIEIALFLVALFFGGLVFISDYVNAFSSFVAKNFIEYARSLPCWSWYTGKESKT
jgi:hypothetical protein